jgi:hypothetical protein
VLERNRDDELKQIDEIGREQIEAADWGRQAVVATPLKKGKKS